MRILIIEDDKSLSELITYGLEEEGFTADCCHDGNEGLLAALMNMYDLILLDRMLPGLPGEDILRRIRQEDLTVPVIFITAIGDSAEKITGLDLGADDYLVKPFDIGELLARIRSVMRRTAGNMNHPRLTYGDLEFSEKESKLIHKESSYVLSKREAELLACFFHHPDKVLSRQQIISNVWGADAEIEDGNLDTYIWLLRKRLTAIKTSVHIATIHRQGYCMTIRQDRRQ